MEKDIKFSPVQNNSQHDATAASINEDHWKEIRKNWAEIGVELSEDQPFKDMEVAIRTATQGMWGAAASEPVPRSHRHIQSVAVTFKSMDAMKRGAWENQLINIHFSTRLDYDKMIVPWYARLFGSTRYRRIKAIYTVKCDPYLKFNHPVVGLANMKKFSENVFIALDGAMPKTLMVKKIDIMIDQDVKVLGSLTEWARLQVIKFKFNMKRRNLEHDSKRGQEVKKAQAQDQPRARSSYETIDD